jgi:hypothetical protein
VPLLVLPVLVVVPTLWAEMVTVLVRGVELARFVVVWQLVESEVEVTVALYRPVRSLASRVVVALLIAVEEAVVVIMDRLVVSSLFVVVVVAVAVVV